MDANATRFHLLLGQDDWADRCVIVPPGDQPGSEAEKLRDEFAAALHGQEPDVSWNDRNELTLGARVTIFPSAPANHPPDPTRRRGAAVDEFGEIFWISDDEHQILVARAGEPSSRYWGGGAACETEIGAFGPVDDPAPQLTLRGLAVVRGGYLIAGALELHGLLVFDLRTGGSPRQLVWPGDIPFEPFDLAETPDGGVAVLDQRNARVWRLNGSFEVIAPWLASTTPPAPTFHALDGTAGEGAELVALTEHHGFPTSPHAIAIEVANDGSVFVLISAPITSPPSGNFATIRRYRDGQPKGEFTTELADALIEDVDEGFSLLAHDFAYVIRDADHFLYVVGAGGDQGLVFRLLFKDDVLTVEPMPFFVPLRLFGGKGFAASGDTVYYDFGELWLPLVVQPRGRYEREATVRVVKLDGKQTDCVWHRLFLDACIPPECDVVVSTRCSNDDALLDGSPLMSEPKLVRRRGGSELPFAAETCGAGIETWELLFQRAKGRWLQIELRLVGNGRTTPRIRALRAYYPRFSYLEHYLPGVYRENAESASFVDRFLALFEGFFTTIEDRIAAAQMLFDVRSAPSEALAWLASWFAVAFDESWSERKRRLFLAHAVEFFEWRGTPSGMLAALRLALEECPSDSIFEFGEPLPRTGIRIQESFRKRPPVTLKRIETDQLNNDRLLAAQPGNDQPDGDPSPASSSAPASALGNQYATMWAAQLQRSYGSAAALNEKYKTTFANLEAVPLDATLAAERALFETMVLPMQQRAHQFSVFLPLPPGSTDGPRRIDVAKRVLALEKPAHTTFTVDFYWTWFRLGEARLGEDTVIDLGSRSPSLIAPYVVNGTRIGAGYLAPDSARIGPGRVILGRSCNRPASPSSSAGESR